MNDTLEDEEYSFEKMREKWAKEVGRFVMAFGSIEGSTYAALRHCARDPIAQPLIDANLNLKPRIEVLLAIAGTREGKRWERFARVLSEVKALAGKRNLIAHNGVGADVFVDAAGEYSMEETIRNHKKWPTKNARDRIAFHELVVHRERAETLDGELIAALAKVLELVGAEQKGDTAFVNEHKDR